MTNSDCAFHSEDAGGVEGGEGEGAGGERPGGEAAPRPQSGDQHGAGPATPALPATSLYQTIKQNSNSSQRKVCLLLDAVCLGSGKSLLPQPGQQAGGLVPEVGHPGQLSWATGTHISAPSHPALTVQPELHRVALHPRHGCGAAAAAGVGGGHSVNVYSLIAKNRFSFLTDFCTVCTG